MSDQYCVGFVLEAVRHALRSEAETGYAASALSQLSTIEVSLSAEAKPVDHSLFAVADNLLSRGRPTLASVRVERTLSDALGMTREAVEDDVSIRFPLKEELSKDDIEWLLRALAIVDPRVQRRLEAALPALESEAERAFHDGALPGLIGPWALQLVELQRSVEMILPGESDEFVDQRLDFSVELPRQAGGPAGLVIEIDGMQHRDGVQLYLDKKRVQVMEKAGWRTVRIEARKAGRFCFCPLPNCSGTGKKTQGLAAKRKYEAPEGRSESPF